MTQRSVKLDSYRRSVGPMAASATPQTRRCGKRLRAPGGSLELTGPNLLAPDFSVSDS